MESPATVHNFIKKREISLTEPSLPIHYRPDFDLDFVERLLGRQSRSEISRSTRQLLDIQQDRLRELIRPRITWEKFSIFETRKSGVKLVNRVVLQSRKMAYALKEATEIVVFLATVGRRLDREIECLMNGGAMAHGYVADALGSGAVESLVERFHADIARELAKNNKRVGLRYSPGYCDWHVSEQQKLFSLLDHAAVGVELADTSLMAPRKSVSGLFGIYDINFAPSENWNYNPCSRCAKKDCIARRVEKAPPAYYQ